MKNTGQTLRDCLDCGGWVEMFVVPQEAARDAEKGCFLGMNFDLCLRKINTRKALCWRLYVRHESKQSRLEITM